MIIEERVKRIGGESIPFENVVKRWKYQEILALAAVWGQTWRERRRPTFAGLRGEVVTRVRADEHTQGHVWQLGMMRGSEEDERTQAHGRMDAWTHGRMALRSWWHLPPPSFAVNSSKSAEWVLLNTGFYLASHLLLVPTYWSFLSFYSFMDTRVLSIQSWVW